MSRAKRVQSAENLRIKQCYAIQHLRLHMVHAFRVSQLDPIVVYRAIPEFLKCFFDSRAIVRFAVEGANRDAPALHEQTITNGGEIRFQLFSFRQKIAEGNRFDVFDQIAAKRAQPRRLDVECAHLLRKALDSFAIDLHRVLKASLHGMFVVEFL